MSDNIFDLVGNTPLLRIPHPNEAHVPIYAKAEYYNPGGSVKDRPVKFILKDLLAKNKLRNRKIIDATSGNTGIAYAMLGAAMNLDIELAVPENASEERKRILELYGAHIHYTSRFEGTDGAQNFVRTLMEKKDDEYCYPDQYNNENNWKAHFETTGPEIWEQSNGMITHFCTGIGTSGTFIGTSRFLKNQSSNRVKQIECIEVLPDNPIHGLEGWKHLETALIPGIYDKEVADKRIEVSTENAFSYAIAAAKYLGLLISPSSAANIWAAIQLAEEIKKGFIVTILPDNAFKYLRDPFWTNPDFAIANPFVK